MKHNYETHELLENHENDSRNALSADMDNYGNKCQKQERTQKRADGNKKLPVGRD
jgi:hypothetical protein